MAPPRGARLTFWFVTVSSVLVGLASTLSPTIGLVGVIVLVAVSVVLRHRVPLHLAVLFVLVLSLATLARGVSIALIAGVVPLPDVILILLIAVRWKSVSAAVKQSQALKVLIALWAAWITITLYRLAVDIPNYGQLAARDSLVSFEFAAILLGASFFSANEDAVRRFVERLADLAALFSLLYPVTLMQGAGDGTASLLLGYGNIGILGAALLASGIVSGDWRRWYWTMSGAIAVAFSQGRMIYLVVAFLLLLAFWVKLFASRGRRSGYLRFGPLVMVLVSVAAIPAVLPDASGRLGDVSTDSIMTQVRSVFVTDSATVGGSIEDRKEWWPRAWSQFTSSASTVFTGVGFGPDLVGGFRGPSGELIRKPHNDYLEAMVRGGVVAGVALLSVALMPLVLAGRRVLSFSRIEWFMFSWLLAASATAFAQPYFAYAHGVMPAGLIVGYLMTTREKDRGTAATEVSRAIPL